jgi:hypothetical protein
LRSLELTHISTFSQNYSSNQSSASPVEGIFEQTLKERFKMMKKGRKDAANQRRDTMP